MKCSRRIDFLAIATLAMMALALPLSLLHITSSLFPESAANRLYSSFAFSAASTETATGGASKPILFIIRKPGEDVQIINMPYLNTGSVTPEITLNNTCGTIFKI